MYVSIFLMEITGNAYIRESLVSWFILRLESACSQGKPDKLPKNPRHACLGRILREGFDSGMTGPEEMDETNLRHSLSTEL
ncbi:MAG TPA: hypothetical protein DDY76_08860 [Opitutae bacterium]|nr:hypothetical protein [Opitutae bacterium]